VAQIIPPDSAIPAHFRGDPGNVFYYVDNFDLVYNSGCEYHIYGHTHDRHSFELEGLKFRCNPHGYPGENKDIRLQAIEL